MHSTSPTPTRRLHHQSSSDEQEADELQQTIASIKSILFISSIILLVITSLSCFATSYVVTSSLIDWPLGSVVQKRSSLYEFMSSSTSNNNNKNNRFSLLHAALQRDDHCHDETKQQLDRALGVYATNEIEEVIQKAEQKKQQITTSVEESLKKVQESRETILSEHQTAKRDGLAANSEIQNIVRQRRKSHNFKKWEVPSFAIRASKIPTHELEMFYAKHNNNNNQDVGDPHAVTSVTAIAAAFANVINFANSLTRPLRESNALVYATNTVDKILYQLRNFEPLVKRISRPQWNPVTGLTISNSNHHDDNHDCPRYKKLVLGLSSVSRKKNYLFQTISSLLSTLNADQLKEITIVVLNADVPPSKNQDAKNLHSAFEKYFNDGTLILITRGEEEAALQHPEMRDGVSSLAHRWGDDDNRVWWRTKQVLDVAFLMDWVTSRSYDLLTSAKAKNNEDDDGGNRRNIRLDQERSDEEQEKCKNFGGYFLMLEDDISATKHYSTKVLNWVRSALFKPKDVSWTVASFYNPWPVKDKEKLPPYKFFGVIGQLFRIHDLPTMVEFLKKNFDQSPLDWLFVDYLKKMDGHMVVHTPSMFQHEGVVSSLEGKTQDGRAVDFRP